MGSGRPFAAPPNRPKVGGNTHPVQISPPYGLARSVAHGESADTPRLSAEAATVATQPCLAAVGRTQRRGESVDAIPPARGSDTPIRVLNLVRTSEGDCVALSHRSTAGLTLTEVIHD